MTPYPVLKVRAKRGHEESLTCPKYAKFLRDAKILLNNHLVTICIGFKSSGNGY